MATLIFSVNYPVSRINTQIYALLMTKASGTPSFVSTPR